MWRSENPLAGICPLLPPCGPRGCLYAQLSVLWLVHPSVCWSVLCAICLPVFVPRFIHMPLMAILLSCGSSVSLRVPSISLLVPLHPYILHPCIRSRALPCLSGAPPPTFVSSPHYLPFQPSQALLSPRPPRMSHACPSVGMLCLLLLAELFFPEAVPPTSFNPLLRWCYLHCELLLPPAHPMLPSI